MISLPGEFPFEDRFCNSRKGRTRGGGWGHPKGEMAPAKPCVASEAHPLGAERATCRVFSMSEGRKLSFILAVPPNCMFDGCFQCQSTLTLSERKLVRKWAWSDSRIIATILAMPGPVAVCILESEKPTGPEIRYVKVILRLKLRPRKIKLTLTLTQP